MSLTVYQLHGDDGTTGILPKYMTEFAACADVAIPKTTVVAAHSYKKIPTYLHFDIENGYKVVMYPRSSTLGKGLIIPVSIIDSDYRGMVHVPVYNFTSEPVIIEAGERVVQIELQPATDVKTIERKYVQREGGFGSTDDKR
jgi:dUTP pyrophosphatase